ncbi:MAG: ATP-binding protein [Bacilli bacterium]|nr:ATP-binding protein [Bacilli bacterium]
MKLKANLLRKVCFGALLSVGVLTMTSCASADKKAYVDWQTTIREYSDKSEITVKSTIRNECIYNLEKEHYYFNCYNENKDLVCNYDETRKVFVKFTESSYDNFSFIVNYTGIKSVELDHWDASFSNLWSTYKGWFIAMIVIASLGAVAYCIFIFLEDADLGDSIEGLIDIIEDAPWILAILIAPLGIGIWGAISSNWVPICIVLGGIGAFIVLALLEHLVLFLFELFGSTGFAPAPGKNKIRKKRINYMNEIKKLEQNEESEESEETEDDASPTTTTKGSGPKPKVPKKGGITFDDIAGLEDAKEAFREKVILPFENPEIYKKYGKKAGGGILLYGLPGTGKTMFAEAASNLLSAKFFSIKCSDIKSKWYGQSEKNVKDIFKKARAAKRAIIFFDEFEAIGAKRTDSNDNLNNDLVPQILAEMQGVGSEDAESTIMVIAATNKPWAIDSAFLRPGRFDEKIYIPLPDAKAREKLFENGLKKTPTKDLDYKYLSKITEGFNGADIKEVCEKLKMNAINKSIKDKKDHPVCMDDVHAIEKKIKTSVAKGDIERLERFEDEY